MADTEISRLPELLSNEVQETDPLAIADLSAVETKKITIGQLFVSGTNLVPDGSINPSKIDWASLVAESIDGTGIVDRSITAIKLAENTLTATEIAPNAIGSSELADGACDEASIQNGAVTADKIAGGQISDIHISNTGLGTASITPGAITRDRMTLVADDIDGSVIADNSLTAAEIAPNAIGSSELADGSVDENALQDFSITGDKLQTDAIQNRHLTDSIVGATELINGSVISSKLAVDSVTTDKVLNNNITAEKLAPGLPGTILAANAIDTETIADDAITNEKLADDCVNTNELVDGAVNDAKISGVNGGKLESNSVPALAFEQAAFSDGITLDGTVKLSNQMIPGSQAGIEWNINGMVVSVGPMPATDLPIATTTTVGAVSVPASSGLTVSAAGVLDHANKISPGTTSGFTYDENGNIVNAVPLVSTDLPNATNTTKGACSFPTNNDNPIVINGDAQVTHSLSGITPGTYVSLSVNQYGLVDGGAEVLVPNQVPGLDASKITSGQFATNRLADDAVTMPKLADYSVSFIQEAVPQFAPALHIGCLWYQPSTAQLRMYDGNVWANVGFGRLAQENLRWGGTVNADTGLVANLTDQGRTAGLEIGEALPAATDALGGLYLVVSAAGSNIGVLPGVPCDAGDWVLAVNQADGWIRINVSDGGSSGAALLLNDLLDVDINNVQGGDTLIYDEKTGQWTNRTTTADRVSINPAFDGQLTTFTLSMEVFDQNNVLMSLGGVILEPGVDFTIPAGTKTIDFVTPPPAGTGYFLINQQTVNASSAGGGGGGTSLPPGTPANELLQWNNTLSSWGPTTEIDGGQY